MNPAQHQLEKELTRRAQHDLLRKLSAPRNASDFCSNDYLGFAKSQELRKYIEDNIQQQVHVTNGSTGSRLITGNSIYTEMLEDYIAIFHHAEAALIFNSGYDANLGLLSCIGKRNDTLICDEYIHASLIDGARLSFAKRKHFKHNDLTDLETKLKKATGTIFVVVESIYSMGGDEAPLEALLNLCEVHQASLIVDEAHAVGLRGLNGAGLVAEKNLSSRVFARTVTFGKALGTHGAAVIGSVLLKQYLLNFSRPLIYTTAAPPHNLVSIRSAYEWLMKKNIYPLLQDKITFFNDLCASASIPKLQSTSPIHAILIGGNKKTKHVANTLQTKGFDVRPILSPTVPTGTERLRICLHVYNADAEIQELVTELAKLL